MSRTSDCCDTPFFSSHPSLDYISDKETSQKKKISGEKERHLYIVSLATAAPPRLVYHRVSPSATVAGTSNQARLWALILDAPCFMFLAAPSEITAAMSYRPGLPGPGSGEEMSEFYAGMPAEWARVDSVSYFC